MNGTDSAPAHRRLSRETRNLLIAACVALLALWILARLRFPDRPVTTNPISPVLTQMTAQPAFAELASEVARVRIRLRDVVVPLRTPSHTLDGGSGTRTALRIRQEAAVALLGSGPDHADDGHLDVLVADRASGLAIVRVPPATPGATPVPWAPVRLDAPRFLMMTGASADGFSVQPVFVGSLSAFASPAWSAPVWLLPSGTGVSPGALLFTNDGELVGLSVQEGERLAIVPGETLLVDAQRLLDRGPVEEGDLGIEAQRLTGAIAAATGAVGGAVVTWVAPEGPAAGRIRPGDVIETLDGAPIRTLREWQVRARRVSAGQAMTLAIRRGGDLHAVEISAAPRAPAQERALGLTLRFVTGVGSEVVRVDPGSAAEAAGIVRGDIITVVGTTTEPTPARIRLAFTSTEDTSPLLVALTRGGSHHVTALVR